MNYSLHSLVFTPESLRTTHEKAARGRCARKQARAIASARAAIDIRRLSETGAATVTSASTNFHEALIVCGQRISTAANEHVMHVIMLKEWLSCSKEIRSLFCCKGAHDMFQCDFWNGSSEVSMQFDLRIVMFTTFDLAPVWFADMFRFREMKILVLKSWENVESDGCITVVEKNVESDDRP